METTPERFPIPRRPRAVEQNHRGCPSGLVLGEVPKEIEGGVATVDDLDLVRERMGIEHRADGGQVDRVIINDDDSPRWGRGGLLHSWITSLRAVRARHVWHESETSMHEDFQKGCTLLP